MNKKAKTPDERFIICIYEAASKMADVHAPLNRYEIGHMAGLQPKGVDAICKLLIQANFIKKGDNTNIYLTNNGEALALRLLEE